jgi:preprotein translocase subunit YajC
MGITMAQLSRKTQWLRRSERKDVLASLVEGEEVVTQETVTLGRKKTVLIARDFLAP